jgi:hypothetical protein
MEVDMAETIPGDAKEPARKFGAGFWVLWVMAMIAATAAFFAAMQWNMAQEEWSMPVGVAATLVFTVAIWLLAMTPYMIRRKQKAAPPMRPPIRRYMTRFMPAMLVYVVVLMPAMQFYQDSKPEGLLAWATAVAPAIPLLFAIRAIMLYYQEEDDEFRRAMAVQSHILATGLTLAVCTVYGFLDLFGLVPHVEAWAVVPLWALCLVPAQIVAGWKFR